MSDIPKVVITGGPCGGKTKALAAIAQFCQNNNRYPVIIPEAATDLITAGFKPSLPEFQHYVLKKILFEEELRQQAFYSGDLPSNSVFIYDRGLCDGRAYVNEAIFNTALARNDLDLVRARDQYNGVIFLHSAANGAEKFYTLENNAARSETLAEARALNQRTLEAWTGTPHLCEIPNRPNVSFDGKIQECLVALARIIGLPEPVEYERKYLLETFLPDQLPDHAVPINIMQTYLVSQPGQTERVRARGQANRYLYFHTTKVRRADGSSYELDELVDKAEYKELLTRRDDRLKTIHKTRYCFHYEGHYCELDVFLGQHEGLCILEVEVEDFGQTVTLPPYLNICREVTHDRSYSNRRLANL